METSVPDLDPSLIDPALIDSSLNAITDDAKLGENIVEGQVFDNNEDSAVSEREEQAGYHISDERNNDMIEVDLVRSLGISLMGDNDASGSNNTNVSVPNRNEEYSEQEYCESISDDEYISASEYSDEEDLANIEESLRQGEEARLADQLAFSGTPLNIRIPTSPSPPSYSPPPTPVLRLAPLFPPGVNIPAAGFFEDPVRFATRINARKVRMHEARITIGEDRLRQLPGSWWCRCPKVPTSLRRCWTPYDMFDAYLENTLVAIHDHGAKEAELKKGAEVIE
ncbi:hypothetical protein MFRU_001g02820 [Monilinia fructicola]|uniref:Uncharacterized protein n=1 Tax=Monilinia fructicola TaxID=38448 RepID=A0A5M9JWA4_MONFR|nr:hypothetical protein EYC84_005364 [Monilinia fructicola]KAG4035513.1 hypothetical protein MFRU_001g02820 [Monilinia fructicola]